MKRKNLTQGLQVDCPRITRGAAKQGMK